MLLPLLFALLVLGREGAQVEGVAIIAEDRASLLKIKEAFVAYPGTLSSWKSSNACEDWLGLECDDEGYVINMYIDTAESMSLTGEILDNNTYLSSGYYGSDYILYEGVLNGTLSPAIGNLSRLESLIVANTALRGAIPPELGNLQNLKLLNLSNNILDGPIPPELGNLTKLIALDLNANFYNPDPNCDPCIPILSINGALPSELGQLTNLEYMDLGGYNNLSGSLPLSFSQLKKLKFLGLQGPQPFFPGLVGNLSIVLESFTDLEHLDLSLNNFTGGIPAAFGSYKNLTYLDLSTNYFSGPIPSEMGNLVNLKHLDVSGNNFTALPDSIGQMASLQYLNAGSNDISSLPSSIGNLTKLTDLGLYGCGMSGAFPDLTVITDLQALDLSHNFFTSDTFPTVFKYFVGLKSLQLDESDFNGAAIPDYLVELINLQVFSCSFCNLSGPIPVDLGLHPSLQTFVATDNSLTGTLPSSIGGLTTLNLLALSNNHLNGTLPSQFGSLSALTDLDLDGNAFTGAIPDAWLALSSLQTLYLQNNQLTSLPESIGNLQAFLDLDLSNNSFTSPIPRTICNMTGLVYLTLSNNGWGGTLPDCIGDLAMLTTLICRNCGLRGPVPPTLSRISTLEQIDLSSNSFTGHLANEFFDNFTTMSHLSLSGSSLTGSVPSLTSMTNLRFFDMSYNQFEGSFPSSFPPTMLALDLSYNRLKGNVTSDFSTLSNIQSIFINDNVLTGPLPVINASSALTYISLAGNSFTGTNSSVPLAYYNASTADLSGNPLCSSLTSGSKVCTPQAITGGYSRPAICPQISRNCSAADGNVPNRFLFKYLNGNCTCSAPLVLTLNVYPGFVKFYSNNVCVQVTAFVAAKAGVSIQQVYLISSTTMPDTSLSLVLHIFGTGADAPPLKYASLLSTNLARKQIADVGLVHLSTITPTVLYHPPANSPLTTLSTSGGLPGWVIAVIAIMSVLLLLALWAIGYIVYDLTSPKKLSELEERLRLQEVRSLSLKELREATNNFKVILGEGGYGIVYKGVGQGQEWAVKRAKVLAQKGGEFESEIEKISRLHHNNVVRLLGYHMSKHEQIVVYEFMAKGTLKQRLQTTDDNQVLAFHTRVDIALGAAEGLRYLHNFTRPAYIHRDIKSDNILLDAEYTAKIADFGVLKENTQGDKYQRIALVGTPGYMDPEYFSTQQVSTKSDVFSFGVVLLEMITGRHAVLQVADESGNLYAISLVSWVHLHLDKPEILIDPKMPGNYHAGAMKLFIRLALSCVERAAKYRPNMDDVSRQLLDIRVVVQGKGLDEPSEGTQSTRDSLGLSGSHSNSYSMPKYEYGSELSNLSSLQTNPQTYFQAPVSSTFGER
eukprot:TRINITY_DN423_c1_g1_i8.p1 TRINITY_DN423_c1_g1~~TRINITY_DN423_c1_g1_i8.p1  ORF type:complete len:1350 (-),score=247.71 TRINITY_DN423_c1_g1_i8:768-4817(-)